MKKQLRQYAFVPAIFGIVFIVCLSYMLTKTGPSIPAGLSAQETVVQYMTFWQEGKFGAMKRMWYGYHHSATNLPILIADFDLSLKLRHVVDINDVWIDEDGSDLDNISDSFYEMTKVNVRYTVEDKAGTEKEETDGFTLVRAKAGSDWRIIERGYG